MRRAAACGAAALALATALGAGAAPAGAGGAARAAGEAAGAAAARLPNLAYARAQAARYRAVPAWRAPAPGLDAGRLAGRRVAVVPLLSALPSQQLLDGGLRAAARAAGLVLLQQTSDGRPAQWARGIEQALAQGADAIVLSGAPDPAQLAPQLAAARRARVPVVVAGLLPGATGPDGKAAPLPAGVAARVDAPLAAMHRIAADAEIAATKGRLHALLVTAPDVPSSAGLVAAVQDELARVCGPGCTTTVVSVPLARWSVRIAPAVQAALAADPSITIVHPLYDSMTPLAIAGIRKAGALRRVWIGTAGGSDFVLELVQQRAWGGVVRFDVGTSPDWQGWAAVDTVVRLLTGQPLPASQLLPKRLFDAANAAAAGTPPSAVKGYGDAYTKAYRRLWAARG